jgi:hypothetical protein
MNDNPDPSEMGQEATLEAGPPQEKDATLDQLLLGSHEFLASPQTEPGKKLVTSARFQDILRMGAPFILETGFRILFAQPALGITPPFADPMKGTKYINLSSLGSSLDTRESPTEPP